MTTATTATPTLTVGYGCYHLRVHAHRAASLLAELETCGYRAWLTDERLKDADPAEVPIKQMTEVRVSIRANEDHLRRFCAGWQYVLAEGA